MRGPAPTPSNIVKLNGNPGKRAMNSAEPKPRGKAECPHWLGTEARRVWKRHAAELHRLGLLTSVDREIYAEYCTAAARLEALEVEIRRLEAVQSVAYRAAMQIMAGDWKNVGAAGVAALVEVTGEHPAIFVMDGDVYMLERITAAKRAVLMGTGTGLLAVGEKGAPYQHPLVGMRNALVKDLRVLASEFGMTPAARTRIRVEQPAPQGDLFGGGLGAHERPEPGMAAAAGGR